ncbi:hypothetical protein [Cellulomonas alba]|uniref:Flp pilus-assembly TadG-like N-terminal domain-containing protein n=1 Tax=Cellulomonas alba TaxID=3053467 RepID=A0ABT7SB46_9CELL|nr:hypothetical protein [Cellulomonas alba]MDM7853407.1 hypothetical protein [Cellulomonas alba]
MLALRRRLAEQDPERGSALVAAMAVALIGIALASLIVASAIEEANASGADRARTSEVHSAEGAVDQVYAQLQAGTPCRWPASGTATSGSAPSITKVSATITYYDKTGAALPCAAGTVTGAIATAVITGTSQAAGSNTELGGGTRRTVQAKVNLKPIVNQGAGAAIFSANGTSATNSFQLKSYDPSTAAIMWIDSGDFGCNSNATIDASLVVVQGKATLDNACQVTKDLWAKGMLVNAPRTGGGQTVIGNTYVAGDAKLALGSSYGGDLLVAGTLTTPGSGSLIVGGTRRTGIGVSALPQYTKRGLPEVEYKPADWAGFAASGDRRLAYRQWVAANAGNPDATKGWGNNSPTWSTARDTTNNQCSLAGDNYSLNGPLISPTVPTLFDTRACATLQWGPNVTVKLRSDLVIFANSFVGTNSWTVLSADGQAHKLWIIVPDADGTLNGTSTCASPSGNISLAADSKLATPVTTFFYSPCDVNISNTVDFYGQIYGRTVVLQNSLHVDYVPIGIPGVDLSNSTPTSSAVYRVDVVYKREVRNP